MKNLSFLLTVLFIFVYLNENIVRVSSDRRSDRFRNRPNGRSLKLQKETDVRPKPSSDFGISIANLKDKPKLRPKSSKSGETPEKSAGEDSDYSDSIEESGVTDESIVITQMI